MWFPLEHRVYNSHCTWELSLGLIWQIEHKNGCQPVEMWRWWVREAERLGGMCEAEQWFAQSEEGLSERARDIWLSGEAWYGENVWSSPSFIMEEIKKFQMFEYTITMIMLMMILVGNI